MRIIYQIFFITVICLVFSRANSQNFNVGCITGDEKGWIDIQKQENSNYVNLLFNSDWEIGRLKLIINIFKDKKYYQNKILDVNPEWTSFAFTDFYFEPGYKYYIDCFDPVTNKRLFYCREFEIP